MAKGHSHAKNPRTYSVYVVELDRRIYAERKSFRDANPDYDPRKPCVYVGSTGLTPEERFANHRKGHKSARFVKAYGIRLRPRLYAKLNPMTYAEAKALEEVLALRLRKRGYATWWN